MVQFAPFAPFVPFVVQTPAPHRPSRVHHASLCSLRRTPCAVWPTASPA